MSGNRVVLSGGDVVFIDGVMQKGAVVVEGSTITGIEPLDTFKPLDSDMVIDCSDSFVCPGFIDLHNQGGKGFSVMDGTFESVSGICKAHAEHGTTGLLLTTLIEEHTYTALLPNLADTVGKETGGATVLGIHAEGPFTNPERRGFMPLGAISAPDMNRLEQILQAGRGAIVEMTIAPELPGAPDIIARCVREGIVVSLGHSNASLSDVLIAIDCGASHVTHFFNAMRPLNHREPGLAGAALFSNDLSVEIIADGFHIHSWILGLILQNKGVSLTCLITDAMSVMGFEDGDYETLGQRVTLKGGRLAMTDDLSVLAGSVLSMDCAVRNMMTMLGISIVDACAMASSTPAAVLGLENSKGRIKTGFDADIAVLDRTYRTSLTMVKGTIVYHR